MVEPPSAPSRRPDCAIRYQGDEIPAVAGEPVAVALLAAGNRVLSRSIKFHRPRSFCLAGHCNACLMRVGGVPNVRACQAPAQGGLEVELQNAFPSASWDVLGAADWFFPKGMDHHTLLTSPRALNVILQRVVRELGGLGRLPDETPALDQLPEGEQRSVDVAIVGAGPAGLGAAIACARATHGAASILVVDEGDEPGGSLRSDPRFGPARGAELAQEARGAGVELLARAPAFGWFPEDDGGVLAVARSVAHQPTGGGALLRIKARRFLYATGGYDVNALFADNDRPGICAARAVGVLLLRHGVVPGKRPLILGHGPYAEALSEVLRAAGAQVERVDNRARAAIGAHGRSWVSGLEVEERGERVRVRCDLIAVVEPAAPASELARMHGAEVDFSLEGGGFCVRVDEAGRSSAADVFAAGDVCGYRGPGEALAHGRHVGSAIAASLSGAGDGGGGSGPSRGEAR